MQRFPVIRSILILFSLFTTDARAADSPQMWEEIEATTLEKELDGLEAGARGTGRPTHYREFRLNLEVLDSVLHETTAARLDFTAEARAVMPIPMPDGSTLQFVLQETAVMSPELAARYPDHKTYRGFNPKNPIETLSMELAPNGLSARVTTDTAVVLINPTETAPDYLTTSDRYISYERHAAPVTRERMRCHTASRPSRAGRRAPIPSTAWGHSLRTYRLAVAATGEYVQAVGGTSAMAMAAINRTVNRVNQIYRRDFAVQLQLVANNDRLIHLDPATDPFTNLNTSMLVVESQAHIDAEIGDANYDIGHVFSSNDGGEAGLGVVGITGYKAMGATGSATPTGDEYDVDYVAHEIGHQFGANHTYNGILSGCSASEHNPTTAFEPGSGSTILGYAGLCAADDLQPHSDPYFHSGTLHEITSYISSAPRAHTVDPSGNSIPLVDAGVDQTIPSRTPFELQAMASDADGAATELTYTWEQFDLGQQQSLTDPDDGASPLFRSQRPSRASTRSFPAVQTLLTGLPSDQEKLPSRRRESLYRVTVRDNAATSGAVTTDDKRITVHADSGPFQVTKPIAGDAIGGITLVTWDVNNTNVAPVAATHVSILASLDGGRTFTEKLAEATPNDGAALVSLPDESGRVIVKVRAIDNVFYALSPEVRLFKARASVVLSRHAEKGSGNNPDLTPRGHRRAAALARLLDDLQLDKVTSTSLKRTRQTAAPTAQKQQLTLDQYDSESTLVSSIQNTRQPQRYLVVGHSNTVPGIARALGVNWVDPDPLDSFDRLFLINLGENSIAITRLQFSGDQANKLSEVE